MNVAVCGGGRAALAMAADLALMGYKVNLFELDKFKENIKTIIKRRGITLTGKTQSGKTGFVKLHKITTDPEEAIENVQLIMVAVPPTGHVPFVNAFSPYLVEGQCILVNTGYWASLRLTNILKEKNVFQKITVAEANIMPYLADKIGLAQSHIYAIKQDIKLATFPANKINQVFDLIKLIYPQHKKVPNVLWTNFAAGNPSIHAPLTIPMVGILFDRYKKYRFYAEATTPGAKLAEAFDVERLKIAKKLSCDVEMVFDWIQKTYHYSGNDLSDALRRSAHAERWVPRERLKAMIEEDISYFYVPMVRIGDLIGVPTPITQGIVETLGAMLDTNYWKKGITLKDLGFDGLSSNQIVKYVQTGRR